MNYLFRCLLKEHTGWPLIGILAEAAAWKFHDQVIQEFTKRIFESEIIPEPAITADVDIMMFDT